MKFLVLSYDYTGTIVCERLKAEGHEYYYVNPTHRNNGISSISNMHMALNSGIDAAIICTPGFTNESFILRSKNILVFGGEPLQDKIELEADTMKRLCKQYNIRLLKDTTNILYPLSTEVWFSNGDPLYQYINYIKQYKFLAGDLGKDSDGESVVLWGNQDRNVESVKRIFEDGLFDALKAVKYTGIFAVDAYISEDDNYPYVFKVVPRLQAGPLTCMLELMDQDFGNLIMNLLQNTSQSLLLKDSISITVVASQPPYPYNHNEGLIKYITASNTDWSEARKSIGKQLKQIELPNLQYRIDGGIQASHLEDLKRINYYH